MAKETFIKIEPNYAALKGFFGLTIKEGLKSQLDPGADTNEYLENYNDLVVKVELDKHMPTAEPESPMFCRYDGTKAEFFHPAELLDQTIFPPDFYGLVMLKDAVEGIELRDNHAKDTLKQVLNIIGYLMGGEDKSDNGEVED